MLRPLRHASMLDATGTVGASTTPPLHASILPARGVEARIEALVKLKDLRDAGVLTRGQFLAERDRLIGG